MSESLNYRIEALVLPTSLDENYCIREAKIKEDGWLLTGLAHINLFVGSNNSGKSRLLRAMLSEERARFVPQGCGERVPEAAQDLKKLLIGKGSGLPRIRQLRELAEKLSISALVAEESPPYNPLHSLLGRAEATHPDGSNVEYSGHWDYKKIRDWLKIQLAQTREKLGEAFEQLPEKFYFKRLYLPTLRGLRDLSENHTDVYLEATKRSYFVNESKKVEIFTGLKLYLELQEMLLGTAQERKLVREFERFLSENIFDGQSVTLMPRKKSKVVWIRIGCESERPVHDLGDGVQHLIILTFPLFRYQETPMWVFIEEPELFLHPGMQRALVKAMMRFEKHQYFIATHSNHLLDLTVELEDIAIYMVRKQVPEGHEEDAPVKFEIEPASTHDVRLLEELGSRVSSVFLTNCTVWVEGITDRRYVTRFLELYVQHLKAARPGEKVFTPRPDFHFSFVEYSGGNITHWSFLERTKAPIEVTRLCSRLMLIADKDDQGWKAVRQDELRERLGDRFVCLECREVENLLTPEVLTAVLQSYGEDVAGMKPMTQEAYKAEPLGEYLESRLPEGTAKRGYAGPSGTVKDKVKFCGAALEHMQEYEALSVEAKALAERVYEFILSHNRG